MKRVRKSSSEVSECEQRLGKIGKKMNRVENVNHLIAGWIENRGIENVAQKVAQCYMLHPIKQSCIASDCFHRFKQRNLTVLGWRITIEIRECGLIGG